MQILVKLNGQYLCEYEGDSRKRKKRHLSSYPYSFQVKRFKRLSPSEALALAKKWNTAQIETYRLSEGDTISKTTEIDGMFVINSVSNGMEVF